MLIRRKIVIVGATSSMATHCARIWAGRGHADFVLMGRDAARLDRLRRDLAARDPSAEIRTLLAGFSSAEDIRQAVEECCKPSTPDIVLIAHGWLPPQASCEQDLSLAEEALVLNGISPALFAEGFVAQMLSAGSGCLCVIGSVAGDRGRKTNYVYGSAKGLVDRYVQGLQHRLASTSIRVVLVKPGPTATRMTAHLEGQGSSLAPVDFVARGIIDAIDRGPPVVYLPRRWWFVMKVIVHLPRFIFNRLNI